MFALVNQIRRNCTIHADLQRHALAAAIEIDSAVLQTVGLINVW